MGRKKRERHTSRVRVRGAHVTQEMGNPPHHRAGTLARGTKQRSHRLTISIPPQAGVQIVKRWHQERTYLMALPPEKLAQLKAAQKDAAKQKLEQSKEITNEIGNYPHNRAGTLTKGSKQRCHRLTISIPPQAGVQVVKRWHQERTSLMALPPEKLAQLKAAQKAAANQELEQSKEIINAQDIGYTSKLFVQALFPYRKTDEGKRVIETAQGRIVVYADGSLPYGKYPRLIMAYIITRAVENAGKLK